MNKQFRTLSHKLAFSIGIAPIMHIVFFGAVMLFGEEVSPNMLWAAGLSWVAVFAIYVLMVLPKGSSLISSAEKSGFISKRECVSISSMMSVSFAASFIVGSAGTSLAVIAHLKIEFSLVTFLATTSIMFLVAAGGSAILMFLGHLEFKGIKKSRLKEIGLIF